MTSPSTHASLVPPAGLRFKFLPNDFLLQSLSGPARSAWLHSPSRRTSSCGSPLATTRSGSLDYTSLSYTPVRDEHELTHQSSEALIPSVGHARALSDERCARSLACSRLDRHPTKHVIYKGRVREQGLLKPTSSLDLPSSPPSSWVPPPTRPSPPASPPAHSPSCPGRPSAARPLSADGWPLEVASAGREMRRRRARWSDTGRQQRRERSLR